MEGLEHPFLVPDHIKNCLVSYGLGDEFLGKLDIVDALCEELVSTRRERDKIQEILESPDGIDILMDEQKVGRAEFKHFIVRLIAKSLAGALALGANETKFTVNDPEAGSILVTIRKEEKSES